MGFLNSLKKKLKDELSSASDFTLKKSDDSFDFVKHIASSTARNPTKNLDNVLSGLNYGADTLTGAVTSPFYDYKKDQTTGQIKSNFDLKRGLGIYGKEIGTLGMSDALQNDYGLKARQLGRERDGSFLGDIKLAHSFGQQFAGAEDTPAGVRTGLNIALDPTNIIGGGTIGRTGSALEKFGVPGTKLLLGARDAGATSRTARIAGGLIEGMGKYTIPAAVGAGIGAQVSSMTPWRADDQIAPFAGAVLGAGVTKKAELGVKKNVIQDKNGDVFRDLSKHIENDANLPRVAPGSQWKQVLKSRGITDREMEWNGLDESFFATGKITKEDILNRIKENDFDVEETILGPSGYNKWHDDPEIDTSGHKQSIYENYTVPGGDKGTYREILLRQKANTIEGVDPLAWRADSSGGTEQIAQNLQKPIAIMEDNANRFKIVYSPQQSRYMIYKNDDPENNFDFFNLRDYSLIKGFDSKEEAIDYAAKMTSAKTVNNQWEYPQANFGEDILAHIRVDDRDGGRTLFVHEIQSDWAQENRTGNKVHVTHKNTPTERARKIDWKSEPETGRHIAYIEGRENPVVIQEVKFGGQIVGYRSSEQIGSLSGMWNTLDEAKEAIQLGLSKVTGNWPHPFQNNWQDLALKRIIRYASDNGYDRIQLATGEQTLNIPGMGISGAAAEGRKKSYNEILPNKLNDIAKKFGLKVDKVDTPSRGPIPIGSGITVDDLRMSILDETTRQRIIDEWGPSAIEDIRRFQEHWLQFEGRYKENLTFDEFIDKIYEEENTTLLRKLANKVGNYLNMPFKETPPNRSVTLDLTPEARRSINSKPQTMFSVVGDNQSDPNFAKRLDRQQRIANMNEWEKIKNNNLNNPEGSLQGPPPFEGDTKFMTQEEKAAQSNLVRQQMGDSAAKAAAEAKLIGTDTPIEPKSNELYNTIRDVLNKRESIQPMGVGLEAPTVSDHLQEMIWGDNSGLGKSTTRFESARESYIKKGNEFKKPDLPLGDVRQRAEEMLNQLPDDILNMRITNFTAAQDIPWMLNEFDKENMARIKDVELQAYRSQFSNKPATINYNTPLGTAGSQATTAASEVARHEFPEVTMYHGTSGDFEGELKPGSFVTPNRQDAVRYAEADARLTGGQPRVIELKVRQDGMMPPADQGLAAARGAMQITDPALAKRVIPLEEADNSVVTAAEAMDNIQARLTGGQQLGNSNVTVSVLNPDEIRKDLKYLSDMRPMGQIADNVKNIKSNPLTRFIMGTLQVNPSALMHTPIGRLVVAERRQRLAIEEYTNNAMALLDKHMPSLGLGGINRVMNMDDKGVVKNVGKHWNDVIAEAKSTDFKGLEPEQIAFIKSFNDIIDDLKALRLANAIDAMPTEINGRMWVPREVSGIRGTEIEKPTNHNLDRIWELATDAVKNGVKYDDPRETLKLYIYDTYNEIVKRQFADEMIKITDPTESLVSPKYRQTLEQRKAVFDSEKANLKQAVEQYQKDKANPDFKAILEKQKGITKAANSEMRKAQKALELAIKDAKDQESNKQIRYNLDGTTSPVAALRINKAGERVMSRPDAELIRKYIGVGGSPTVDQEESFVAKAFGAAGRGIRVTTSTFDFAAPFTHNLPMLFTNPIGWSKAAAGQYRSYIDPKFKAQYISENLATINEMSKYNVQVGANEYYEAVNPNRGIFGSNYGKGVKQQTIGRFQNAMDTALTIARVEAWKANRDWITDGGTKNFDGLAQYVRNMTGALDSRSLMLSKGQRDFESFWLAFSPRLFRSTVALAGMAMKPTTKQGAAALRSLAVITAGSSAMFYLGNLAAGNSEEDARNSINPLSGRKYLSVKTPYGYIGIGGQVRAASQFIADAGQAMVTGNMSDFKTLDQNQNPIVRWYAGRGAPAIGMLQNTIEATTGANANPYADINGFPDLLVQTGKDFMPFVAQNILEGEDFKQALATGNFSKIWGTDAVLSAVGAFGPRTTPFTRGEETNQRVKAMGFTTLDGKPIDSFKDLNKEQKDQYYERFPVERVKGNDNVTKMFNLIDDANTEFDTDVNNMAANVQMGKMTKLQFREWYQTRQKDKFSRINQIKADFSVMDANRPGFKGSVTDYIASKNVTAEDKAVDAFYAISGNTPLLADGTVDFDGIDAKKKALLQSLTPAQRAYVERMTNKPSQTPDNKMVSEYDIVKDITKPYWEASGAVFDAVKASSGFLSQFANYDAYQNWIAATSQEYGLTPDTVGAFIESKIPDVKKFNEVMSNYKKAMRLTNPYLDRALTEWYGMEPANRLDFVLSGYGSNAGASAAGAIYNGSNIGSRKNSTQLALALKSKQLRQVPRDYSQYQYRLSKN